MERSLVPGQGGLPAGRREGRFEPEQAVRFAERSVSEETRRAYTRVVREFFAAIGNPAPMAVTVAEVQGWRDALLRRRRQKAATVAFKLNVLRAFFGYLVAMGMLEKNPADVRFVIPPRLPESMAGRALTPEEVRRMLCGPDRQRPEGARDYAILLVMLRLGMRVSEVCALKVSDLHWSHGRWIVRFRVKGGRERTLPVPDEVRTAIRDYLKLDEARRRNLHSDGDEAFLFQPLVNYRTLEFAKSLSTRMVQNIAHRWGDYSGAGKVSPHDLRRTAITRALDQGLSYRQVQMMSGHADPKTVMRYDHNRENLDQNAVNLLSYD